jgi:hypothetical protein
MSVQAASSPDNDKLKVATVVLQIMKDLSESVPEEGKIMIATMKVLDLMELNGC